MSTNVVMPKLGESVVEGTVGRWLKQVGERVEEYEPLLEVESDKVDSEIPSPAGGTLLAIYVQPGQTVGAGTVLAAIGAPGEAVPEPPQAEPATVTEMAAGNVTPATPAAKPVASSEPPTGKPSAGNGGSPTAHPVRISPVVANIAAEHGIDVSAVPGTGRGGRVTKQDILAYVEGRVGGEDLPPWEQPGSGDLFKPTDNLYQAATAPADHVHQAPPAPGLPGEVVPLSKMRRRIAEHMVLSKLHTAPHVTTVFEVDLSAVVAHRVANKGAFAARGVNLTFTAYFVAATARALHAHPAVNSQWTDEGILLHRDVNVGMAVAVDDGLIVPVIRHADDLSLGGLARQINDLAARARAGDLSPDDVQGGTFTITNHGVSGSLFATPIINQPQTAILGVGAIQKRVVVTEDDAIAIRPMAYLTLTFDHRVLDGAAADWFMVTLKESLEGWPAPG
jgi:2-oxoglutarate dehydrogenase dihydrolipoamide succinyltransferase (E2 component)